MRLLLIAFGPLSGVREKGNIDLLRLHNPRGVFDEVHVVEPPSSKGGSEKLWDDFVIHHTYIPRSEGIAGKLFLVIGFFIVFLKTLEITKTYSFDLIKAQGPFFSGLIGILVHKLMRIPCIVSLHNDYDARQRVEGRYLLNSRTLSEFIERFTISNASKVFVLTSYLKRYAVRHGANEEDIFILPHKVDPELFQRKREKRAEIRKKLGIKKDEILLVFVGRLSVQKDPLTLLRGYSLAKNKMPDLKLVLVGDGPLREKAEKYVEDEGLTDTIFTGFVPRDEVASIMIAGDAFVLPTLTEGFGFVFIEAQASSLPILTSDIPHTKDIVTEKNALLFPPRNAEELSRQILRLQKEDLREKLSKESEISVRKFFPERLQKREARIFRKIVKSS